MLKIKRISALLISLVLLITLFASCELSDNQPNKSPVYNKITPETSSVIIPPESNNSSEETQNISNQQPSEQSDEKDSDEPSSQDIYEGKSKNSEVSSKEPPSKPQTSKEQSAQVSSVETDPDPQKRIVYTTPSGTKYHYSSTCGGKNSKETTLPKALSSKKTPCKRCVK